jgi:hypothetical protein
MLLKGLRFELRFETLEVGVSYYAKHQVRDKSPQLVREGGGPLRFGQEPDRASLRPGKETQPPEQAEQGSLQRDSNPCFSRDHVFARSRNRLQAV